MERLVITGTPLVEGAAVGKLFYLNTDFDNELASYEKGSSAEEADRFQKAMQAATEDLNNILGSQQISDEERAIIENHVMLINDEAFSDTVSGAIEEGSSATDAVLAAVDFFKAMFADIDDEYLRDRANDVVDVGNRLIRKLLGLSEVNITGENLILMAKDIEPAVMAGLSEEQIRAVVLENGSRTSHSIIIAKSKGFITMVGVEVALAAEYNGQDAMIHSEKGELILAPGKEELDTFASIVEKEQSLKKELLEKAKMPAVSKDGKSFTVAANISGAEEMEKAISYGCDGVGLYRTEFLYMDRSSAPDEELQFEAYKELLEKAEGQWCIIRTLDIGGDKKCEYLGIGEEENPFLGYRAVRICLNQKELFRTQLRALVRASAFGRLGIMVPMIDTVAEIKEVKTLLEEVKADLRSHQILFDEALLFGIMAETPASAFMASSFAKYVDFFSIGTNDLVQYTMAVDRGNQKVGYLYDYFDPAVLRAISAIVAAAKEQGIKACMCGEMAGDPLAVPFLMAIGLDEFSMSLVSAPKVKERIRQTETSACDIHKVLSLESAEEVRAYLSTL